MSAPPDHRLIAADAYRVPAPFRSFAVRSDEPLHAWDARAPYGRIHVLHLQALAPASLAALAAEGYRRVRVATPLEVDHAATTLQDLAAAAGDVGLLDAIAEALQRTRVLGDELADYRSTVATRIDYLAARGSGFHNDVRGHWSRCLFWLLALDVRDAQFVMPHAGVQVPVTPGDLLLFDPTMAHGLCRPRDGAVALEESFTGGDEDCQMFLTGEVRLADAQWAALGSPWLPVEAHRDALDLMVAEFDDRHGTIRRPGDLRDAMKRSTCYVDAAQP